MTADVTFGETTRRLTFIVLHMKCCGDESSYNRRVDAAQRLKDHLDNTQLDQQPVVILGDFNDELTQSIRAGRPSPYDPFLQDTNNYFFPSLRLEEAGLGTFCGNNTTCSTASTIDHLLVTDELVSFYETDSADRFDELLQGIPSYVFSTSDHLPVFARFRFDTDTTVTAIEADETPEAVAVQPAYPNPFFQSTTLTYTLPHAAEVRVEVFDVLGRRVHLLADGFQSAGTHRVAFDAGDLPSGLYVIRFSAGGFVDGQPVVRVR